MGVSRFPLGGRTKYYLKFWEEITKDPFVLDCILGCKINFTSIPVQSILPHQINFNREELLALLEMINKLENERVIQKCSFEIGDFLNTVFLREKKNSEGTKNIE